MTVQGVNSNYAFSGNPIIISDSRNPVEGEIGRLELTLGDRCIYTGNYTPPVSVNISEILKASIPNYPEVPAGSMNPVVCLETHESGTVARHVEAIMTYNGVIEEMECIVLPGGISSQNYSHLIASNQDIFTQRFFNYTGNFFLTTRSNSWRIEIPETELMPLYFRVNAPLSLMIEGVGSTCKYDAGALAAGTYALDISALRRFFFDIDNTLLSQFDIIANGIKGCRISVIQSAAAAERYHLKFRNSLGCFEMIELTGQLIEIPELADETEYRRYNPVTDTFMNCRDRVQFIEKYQISTGIKTTDELRFMIDMLTSEEVYFIRNNHPPVPVIPEAEKTQWHTVSTRPEQITLTLTPIESEPLYSKVLNTGKEAARGRLFTDHFSNHFN